MIRVAFKSSKFTNKLIQFCSGSISCKNSVIFLYLGHCLQFSLFPRCSCETESHSWWSQSLVSGSPAPLWWSSGAPTVCWLLPGCELSPLSLLPWLGKFRLSPSEKVFSFRCCHMSHACQSNFDINCHLLSTNLWLSKSFHSTLTAKVILYE